MEILATLAAASGLFVGTNIDDIVVIAILNVSSRASGRPKIWHVWAGQYAGIAILVAVSLLSGLGLALVLPERYMWILGLLPLMLGINRLFGTVRTLRSGARPTPAVANGLSGVIALTVINGGDNIAAYTPFFRAMSAIEIGITVVAFAIGVGGWCLLGAWVVSHQAIMDIVQRRGHWIVPAVFIVIGLYVVQKGAAHT